MADEELKGSESMYMVIEGAPEEAENALTEALLLYAQPSKGPQEDMIKAAKLRGAFTMIQNWLLAQRLPNLNDAQWLFLSYGALGSRVKVQKGGGSTEIELISDALFDHLVKARQAKKTKPGWAAPILDFEDRVHAIANGEMVPLDAGGGRKKKPSKMLGAEHLKEKLRNRLDILVAASKELLGATDTQLQAFATLRDENTFKAIRTNFEALRRYALFAPNQGKRSEQEAKVMNALGERLGAITQSIVSFGAQVEEVGSQLASRADALEGKFMELRSCLGDMDKVESGQASETAAFDSETISSIRRDEDTAAMFTVKSSENSELKVAFSGSRILVKDQWREDWGGPENYLATVPAVIAALEKLTRIHVNAFPRDPDGQYMIPPICIEPIRNFVDFFDDRLLMSFVAGENPRRGAKVSLSPLECQVMRAIGCYLAKDSLYDYRGEINSGTFIGDYSGKMEKKTSVKWTGEDKKFTLASTSQVVDGASRTEAVQDYMDLVFTFINGMTPPQKLSRRKIAVLLRYVIIESVQRTVSLALMHVAQTDPQEAKATILKHVKNEDEAKEMVIKAFEDPTVAKVCGDRDYFLTKVFGKAQ